MPRPRYVLGDALISQFPIGADFKADFAFAFFNSTGVYLELIEIESPTMRMFTQNDEFSRPIRPRRATSGRLAGVVAAKPACAARHSRAASEGHEQ